MKKSSGFLGLFERGDVRNKVTTQKNYEKYNFHKENR